MEILPPRRPGQLGAIQAGTGVAGPSGGFSIGASAKAKASPAPMVKTVPPKPGSIAPLPATSISEQVALKQSTSAAAAQKALPKPQADVFAPKATVAVQSYAPPPGTPAITKPAPQPNASLTVRAVANQTPVTKAQAIQKVLAEDAGIVVPIRQPPVVPSKPGVLPPGARAPEPTPIRSGSGEGILFTTQPAKPPAGGPAKPQPVLATTNPDIGKRLPPPPVPIITPVVMKTAADASGALVSAKLAEQKAAAAIGTAQAAAKAFAAADAAVKEHYTEAKQTIEELKAADEKAYKAKQEYEAELKSQVLTEDEKAEAAKELRKSLEEAAYLKQKARDLEIQLAEDAAKREAAAKEARAAAAAADAARAEAARKEQEAAKKAEIALEVQAKTAEQVAPLLAEAKSKIDSRDAEPVKMDSGNGGAQIIPFPTGGSSGGGGAAADSTQPYTGGGDVVVLPAVPPQAQPPPATGAGATTKVMLGLLGVGVVAAIAYAVAKQSSDLNGVPLVAELDEDEE